ncbi:hypothetical protein B0O99DRAFT_653300 [Bisporella sp. PMI_857]|nr:hypothetical protein B0O99DRAFT_653300 [Bisporella sp. PMI_857]
MATRTHGDFLGLHDSDEDASVSEGYNSDIEVRQKGNRSLKRRKVDSDVSDGSDDEELEEVHENDIKEAEDTHVEEPEVKMKPQRTRRASDLPGVSKPLTKKNLVASEKAIRKSGVVYLSRIPPFMKPTKLRSLLEPYGAINRIFLTPEDPASHTRRVRNGGNKKRSFTDGWVEFVSKKDAKKACELLNAQTIGGKKGTYYRDDVWTLLYLKHFKWNNLTEEIAAENAEKSARMRAEISKTTKENKEFIKNAARAKIWETREAKQAAKRKKEENAGGDEAEMAAKKQKKGGERPRNFTQHAVASKKQPDVQPDQVKRVLSKIF